MRNKVKIQKLIFLIDCSGSMNGQPIESIKQTLTKLTYRLEKYKRYKVKVDLQIIAFNKVARFISKYSICNMVATDNTNLEDAYRKLGLIYKTQRHFDYPPIVVLLCDGCPNMGNYHRALNRLYAYPEFRRSKRLAFAYNTTSIDALAVLKEFPEIPENTTTNNSIGEIVAKVERLLDKTVKGNFYNSSKKLSSVYKQYKKINYNKKKITNKVTIF